MGKKLARFQLVTHLSFILSYLIDYLKDTDLSNLWGTRLGKNLQIQIQTLTLENKCVTSLYLQILWFCFQWYHFPTQNLLSDAEVLKY